MRYAKTINLIQMEIERCQRIISDNNTKIKSLTHTVDVNKRSIEQHKKALQLIEACEDKPMKTETVTDGFCADDLNDEFTDESAVDFLKELSENPSKGEYNHIPDDGGKVVE